MERRLLLEQDEFVWLPDQSSLVWNLYPLELETSHVVIGGWQRQLSWYPVQAGQFVEPVGLCDGPGVELLFEGAQSALQRWRSTIPDTLLRQALCCRPTAFVALRTAAADLRAAEMLETDPLLLALWVDYCRSVDLSNNHFLYGLSLKRHRLLVAMGAVNGKAALRFLRRFNDRIDAESDLSRLFHFIVHPSKLNTIRHQAWFNRPILRLLDRFPELAATTLTKTYGDLSRREQSVIYRLITDCCSMNTTLMYPDFYRTLGRCDSLAAVQRYHDRLVVRFNRLPKEGDEIKFPPPPLEGNQQIIPLRTIGELRLEGVAMRHCVGSYQKAVVDGNYFVYHIENQEERATLGVKIYPDRSLRIDELRGYANEPISDAIRELAFDWFTSSSPRAFN